jgi:hypothetical protein
MPPRDGPADRPVAQLFVLIVIVEAITIAALYYFGRHFS